MLILHNFSAKFNVIHCIYCQKILAVITRDYSASYITIDQMLFHFFSCSFMKNDILTQPILIYLLTNSFSKSQYLSLMHPYLILVPFFYHSIQLQLIQHALNDYKHIVKNIVALNDKTLTYCCVNWKNYRSYLLCKVFCRLSQISFESTTLVFLL